MRKYFDDVQKQCFYRKPGCSRIIVDETKVSNDGRNCKRQLSSDSNENACLDVCPSGGCQSNGEPYWKRVK